jgi:acyl-coenzyme A thioesterase PaaI-like protein
VQTQSKELRSYSVETQRPEVTQERNQRYLRPLTTDEVLEVNLNTVREGVNHCRWPIEVIQRFLAVEV